MQLQYEEDVRTRTKESRVRDLPYVKTFPFEEGWTDDKYTDLMAEWNIYAPHEVPEVRADPAEATVIALQRELIRNVGDDVATGILSVRAGAGQVEFSPENILAIPPPPSADKLSNPTLPTGKAFTIAGRDFALPLSPDSVAALCGMALSVRQHRPDAAQNVIKTKRVIVGPDGRNTPFKTRLLKDTDFTIAMGNAAADPATHGIVHGDLAEFNVPTSVREDIMQRLCPDADTVSFVPYRMDIYQPGDALGYSTLPPGEKDEVGHLLVHLPLESDYMGAMTRMAHKNMDVCFDPDRSLGTFENGEQRFYVGRTFETLNEEIPLEIIHNMKDIGVDRPCAAAVLETRVALGEYTALEVTNAEGIRPMRYVAWGPNVVFESLPVFATPIVALRYKVIRNHSRKVWRIPRRQEVMHLVHSAFKFMALRPNPVTNTPGFAHDPAFLRPVHLGIILRHTYEPSQLLKGYDDPRTVLRGLDAVTYRLMSSEYQCRVLPAIVYKSDCHCAAWRVQEFPHRFVFTSMKGYAELRQEIGHKLSDAECMPLLVSALEQTIVNCLWAQIGNGRLLGGGGNAYEECICDTIPDCGTDWWYQNAVLIVSPEPARWARRKPLFSIRDRSADRTPELQTAPRTLAGALAHWNILETTALFL